uniref:HTH cro/C1-type domain-containing protein n=1 Tax=Thermosporothrix sp. COM3 TaxID=2490863 RepID=A0A455T058_9CHLR|nr:hypothetical protein KTC_65260 [Thermosporothrix sp. COM3]
MRHMEERKTYHHGLTIKEFREKRNMSQSKLAALWPRQDGSYGVSLQYVQAVEYGKKRVEDMGTLRALCKLLDIPHWRFGLSEYDPFDPESLPGKGVRLYTETLEVVEHWIERTEFLYRTSPLPEAARDVYYLQKLFDHFVREYPPTLGQQKLFLRLFAQVKNLEGVILLGNGEYEAAKRTFEAMLEIAEQLHELGDPTMRAHALLTVGTEYERANKKHDAVSYLEEARDVTFSTSKNVAAYVHSYLARAYAGAKDLYHFEKAIETAEQLARSVNYGDGTDFVYHPLSGILAEKSYGYLQLKNPRAVLDLRDIIEQQIEKEQNRRLHAWIPYDWAKANLLLGNVEQAVEEARAFYRRSQAMQSQHAFNRALSFAALLKKRYGNVPEVRGFWSEIEEENRCKDSMNT